MNELSNERRLKRMSDKTLNRREIARLISQETGYKIKDVEKIIEMEWEVIGQAIAQGYSIKNHKWLKIDLHKKEPKRAWDGFNDQYFDQPEKYVLKFTQLTLLKNAIDTYNANTKEEDD